MASLMRASRVVARVPLARLAAPVFRFSAAAAPKADAHHAHHEEHGHAHVHPVFMPETWDPMGPPLYILTTCLGAGLGLVYVAYALQMSKFTPAAEPK